MRVKFVKAVAATSGVSVGDVSIDSVRSYSAPQLRRRHMLQVRAYFQVTQVLQFCSISAVVLCKHSAEVLYLLSDA